ncbi:hypothetical protein GOODEAATRI_024302 [Goodea atripinnis]|uniref:Uncharacterized protein n=1 Tax=Goodea atripinnis TaxID=208336 RepID=A0ABV0N492_9TELE
MLTANLRCTRFTAKRSHAIQTQDHTKQDRVFRINSDMGYKYSGSDPKTNREQNKQNKWKVVSPPSQAIKGDKQSGLTKEKISKRTAGSSDKTAKTKIQKLLNAY